MQRALPMMRKKTDPARMYSVFWGTVISPVKCLTSTLRTMMGPKDSTEFMKNSPMPCHSSGGGGDSGGDGGGDGDSGGGGGGDCGVER